MWFKTGCCRHEIISYCEERDSCEHKSCNILDPLKTVTSHLNMQSLLEMRRRNVGTFRWTLVLKKPAKTPKLNIEDWLLSSALCFGLQR